MGDSFVGEQPACQSLVSRLDNPLACVTFTSNVGLGTRVIGRQFRCNWD